MEIQMTATQEELLVIQDEYNCSETRAKLIWLDKNDLGEIPREEGSPFTTPTEEKVQLMNEMFAENVAFHQAIDFDDQPEIDGDEYYYDENGEIWDRQY